MCWTGTGCCCCWTRLTLLEPTSWEDVAGQFQGKEEGGPGERGASLSEDKVSQQQGGARVSQVTLFLRLRQDSIQGLVVVSVVFIRCVDGGSLHLVLALSHFHKLPFLRIEEILHGVFDRGSKECCPGVQKPSLDDDRFAAPSLGHRRTGFQICKMGTNWSQLPDSQGQKNVRNYMCRYISRTLHHVGLPNASSIVVHLLVCESPISFLPSPACLTPFPESELQERRNLVCLVYQSTRVSTRVGSP